MLKQPHYTETENTTDDRIALRESLGDLIHQFMSPAALLIAAIMALIMTIIPSRSNNDAWDFARNLFVGGAFGTTAKRVKERLARAEPAQRRDPQMDWGNYPAQPHSSTGNPSGADETERPQYRGLLQNVELPGEQNDYEARLAEVNINRIYANVENTLDGFQAPNDRSLREGSDPAG